MTKSKGGPDWLVWLALLVVALLAMDSARAAPFIVSDPTPVTRITHCVMVRGTATTQYAAEAVTGGKRCNIDMVTALAPGVSVTVAYRDAATNETGPTATYTEPIPPLAAPTGLRMVP